MFSKHGIPVKIVPDRTLKFKSKYWRCVTELTNIKFNMSTADNTQTDGQSENMIHKLSNMIRSYIQKFPEDWDTASTQLKFDYNCAKHKSAGIGPFEVELGHIPSGPFSRSLSHCNVNQQSISYQRVMRL